jgi:hypothetical protein
MLKALSASFPNLTTFRNTGVEFYDKFQRAADDYDRPFTKKCDEDLNATLIFVGIFPHTPLSLCRFHTDSRGIGRSVLRGHIRFHHRRPKQA